MSAHTDVIIILSPQTGSQELLSTVECNLNIVKRHIAEVMSRVTRQVCSLFVRIIIIMLLLVHLMAYNRFFA